ncbi:unnamed protein product [Diamesa serratosioi]
MDNTSELDDSRPKSISKWKRFTRPKSSSNSRNESRSKSSLEPEIITKTEIPSGSQLDLAKTHPLSKPKSVQKLKNNYVLSERISNLAKPKIKSEFEELYPFDVHPCALKYRPTARVKILAIPRPSLTKPNVSEDQIITDNGVIKKALTAKPNQRTLKLSKPKIMSVNYNDEDLLTDYGVIKEALTAVSSQRTNKLSIPKKRTYEFAYEKPYISQQTLQAQASTRVVELAKPRNLPKELKKKRFKKKRKICNKPVVENYLTSEINDIVLYKPASVSTVLETDFSSEHVLKNIDLSIHKANIKTDLIENVLSCEKVEPEKDLSCDKLVTEITYLMKMLKYKPCNRKLS